MSDKAKNSILILILIGGSLLILTRFIGHLSFPDSSYNFLGKDKKAKLDPGTSITQVFESKQNGLNQIKIIIGNIDKLPFGETILLELRDPACETTLAENAITALTEDPNIYYRFRFPRIENSEHEKYCLKISYEAQEKRGEDRPYIAASDNDTFSNTSYTDTSDGKTYFGRSLQIRPSYANTSLANNLRELENRLSQYKPNYIKGLILLTGCFTILASLFLTFLLIRSKE